MIRSAERRLRHQRVPEVRRIALVVLPRGLRDQRGGMERPSELGLAIRVGKEPGRDEVLGAEAAEEET